jgi:hypothetical protein
MRQSWQPTSGDLSTQDLGKIILSGGIVGDNPALAPKHLRDRVL